jgi:hypothetical protein
MHGRKRSVGTGEASNGGVTPLGNTLFLNGISAMPFALACAPT